MPNKAVVTKKITQLRAKHEAALWKIEKLWAKMGERDYSVRASLTEATTELIKVKQDIDKLESAR